ncbi:MAG: PepSY domain-containing protein [Alphaproteobacteria bacterium]|nr:PepSY domain-containing protein [Alphaproteobacteria bacterium]
MMTLKHRLIVLAAGAAFLAATPAIHPASAQQMRNNCDPGDKIDSSTAPQAMKKMEAAGYSQVHDLMKGCDNYWHGQAMKGGQPTRVVLSPAGQVMQEGD